MVYSKTAGADRIAKRLSIGETMKEQCMGASPQGIVGRILGLIMNSIHDRQYLRIIRDLRDTESGGPFNILDLGCGGGIAVRHFSRVFGEAHVYGVDRSPDMVDLARRVNAEGVRRGTVEILQGDAESLPLPDSCVRIVGVFDTINFWENHGLAFSEIRRVSAEDGIIVIVNGYPEKGTKWYDFVKFKNAEEYKKLLSGAGFETVEYVIRNHTIVIKAKKL